MREIYLKPNLRSMEDHHDRICGTNISLPPLWKDLERDWRESWNVRNSLRAREAYTTMTTLSANQ